MPINPNIILGAVPNAPRSQGPLAALSDALQVATQKERLAGVRLERQQREQEMADTQRLRDIYAKGGNPKDAITETMKVSPAAGLKLLEQYHQASKAEQDAVKAGLQRQIEANTIVAQTFSQVTDEPSFQAAKQVVGTHLGPEAVAAFGDRYDPNVVAAHVAQGTTITEQLRALNDRLQREETNRHNVAGETEANRSNMADEGIRGRNVDNEIYNRNRNTTSQIGDRDKRTNLYGEDLREDRKERQRHNQVGEVLDATRARSAGSSSDGDGSYKEYKDYVSNYEHAQGEARMRAKNKVDQYGIETDEKDIAPYQPPPSFEKWQAMTPTERQQVITRPDARITDAELARRRGGSSLPPGAAPIASMATPAPAPAPAAPPATIFPQRTSAPAPAPTPPPVRPASSHAPGGRPAIQVGQIVKLKDGRRVRVTGVDANGKYAFEAVN